ncbi:MAG: mtultidrug ABC transporter permease/ATPase [uncultured bacterium (gcode 4)]|uniref:Mtultidrug ABC transporter permease/ATPase n=1 Tax=uncultured bacterium (gcode 4) TaxID=1234023 RepID=K2F8A2_9BACT|nr:MAG: mtultidrug ABC transporter permease/ATPase [uncultured bacterium (gcode 4)]
MKQFLKDTKRFLAPALIDRWMFVRSVFIYLVIYGYTYFNIYIIREITSRIESWDMEWFRITLFVFIASVIWFFLINFFARNWWWAEMQFSFMKQIHRIYMSKFIELDNNRIENIWTGKMIAIINSGISNWTSGLIDAIRSITQLTLAFIFAMFIFKSVGYIYLLIFVLIFVIFYIYLHKVTYISLEKRKLRTDVEVLYNNQFVKMIMSKFEIYQNSKTQKEIERLDGFTDEALSLNLSLNQYYYYQYLGPKAFISIFRIVIYFVIWYGIFTKTHKISELIAVIMLLWVIEDTFYRFVDFYTNFTKIFWYIRKLWDTFDSTPLVQIEKWLKKFKLRSGDIEIEDLDYTYWDQMVFKDFSLKIEWGKKTAFVGHSWSGKTTLVKLIIWYLKAEKWNILVDSQNISDIDLQSYYENIWYLTQDPSVFDWSILENLTYWAKHNVTKEELETAIKLAECGFINEFKNWLMTEIWERWIRLSWWQRQRLAIAKIFIKNPKIIVLDEPTSALDSFSEEKISEAFHNLFSGRTVIVIAHRLQTVKEADDIIVLENWEVKERWRHTELVEKNWIYSKMLELQSGF